MPELDCAICNKGRLSKKLITTADIVTGEIFSILECDFCGVKRTDPIPVDLTPYYNNEFGGLMRSKPSFFHSFLKNILLGWEFSRITDRLGSSFEFLDVGCGAGDFSRFINKKGFKVYAVDSATEKPCYLAQENIEYYQIDYENYEIKDFKGLNNGVVILRHVLEHIKNPYKFLEKMTAYGGNTFYIVLPNSSSLKNRLFDGYNFHLDPPRHIWHYNNKSLRVFLDKLNLSILSFGYDTIPTIIPSFYRYLKVNHCPDPLSSCFSPKKTIATAFLPLDWLLPNDVIWMLVKKE